MERQPGGFAIKGVIREMRAVAIFPIMCALLVAGGVACLYIGFALPDKANGQGAIPLVVGFLLTPLFSGLFIIGFRRGRARFHMQVAELESGLMTHFSTGEAERAPH